MRYGFVIDQHRCIGCHACTVACKEEHGVPLGVFRTWVKYIERGTFPDTQRFFSVLRCNHCDDAPCVTICPTRALFKREDGIVDFDNERCIGCKSCMQACPYDALYIDPSNQTAAKCNYCAHRTEVGLEPACVIVCPEQAIIAGDLDDPNSRIAQTVARQKVSVRKPEQGTKPKVFYTGADAASLTPQINRQTDQHVWSMPTDSEQSFVKLQWEDDTFLSQTTYDVPHERAPWGWKVSTYLWTKSISAGVMLLAAFATAFRLADDPLHGVISAGIGLTFLTLTTVLLVIDLKRPERFLYIIFKPNWTSWLVWGSWILMGFGAVTTGWLLPDLRAILAWPTIGFAVAAATYSAFLFGQAEGRDFWQSPLLFFHLLVASVLAGAAALLLTSVVMGDFVPYLRITLVASLIGNALVMFAEIFTHHPNVDAARAAKMITRGPFWKLFMGGVMIAGTLAPLFLLMQAEPVFSAAAAVLSLGGLWIYEHIWIKAGQAVPLS